MLWFNAVHYSSLFKYFFAISWSGTTLLIIYGIFCYTVACPSLTDPNNGVISCSLGDDGVPSYEDTCSFTCNINYELIGSDTRTCQSNGSWNGSETMCSRGIIICVCVFIVLVLNRKYLVLQYSMLPCIFARNWITIHNPILGNSECMCMAFKIYRNSTVELIDKKKHFSRRILSEVTF